MLPAAVKSMSRHLPMIAGGLTLLAGTCLPVRADGPTLENSDELGCAACARAKQLLLLSGPPAQARAPGDRATNQTDTDLLHNDLNIEIIPSGQNIAGQNTMTIASRVDGLTAFEFRLNNTFTISSVEVGATPVSWTRTDSIHVSVTLDRAYDTGEQFNLTVHYSGFADGSGFGSIVWGTSAGKPYVYTLSETYYAYTWWPNKDDNTDKATADLTFTIPDSVYLVSNGLLVSDTPVAGSKRQFHYHTDYPTATYLIQFAMGDYHTFNGSYVYPGGVMPLNFALLSGSDSTSNRNAWLTVEQILPVYADLYGLYPFINEKYGIYQFGFGGGMEHQTMTGQGTTSISVTAHELGHQWWGDMITCATWNHIWLNEGFATYSEALWNEFKDGFDNRSALKTAMSQRKPSNVNGTVFVPDITNINRVFDYDLTYLKGSWVLHMLRGVIGDEDYFATLAAYRAAFEYGSATTEDFESIAESVSGKDLSTFFDQWIYQVGDPAYRAGFQNYSVNGQSYCEVYFQQVQSGSWPTFEMPVTLRFTTASGDHDAVVNNTVRSAHYLVPIPSPCTAVTVDPDLWILRGNNTGTTYVAGPPKIAQAFPAPGASITDPMAELDVAFHRDVQISAAQVSLVGQNTGAVATAFAYDAPSHTLTLTPNGALAPDTYTVTILDSVTDASNALALDGEIANDTLPSGDGLAGGSATYTFTYAPPPPACPGDVDGDEDTDVFDFGSFILGFGITSGATHADGDLDNNGTVDVFDFAVLADDFGCGT